jgi:hypothetical protein
MCSKLIHKRKNATKTFIGSLLSKLCCTCIKFHALLHCAFPSYRRRPKTKQPSQTNREGHRTEDLIDQASGDFDASKEVKAS